MLRFGFERAEVRIVRPTRATQRFLAALRAGVTASDLATVARDAGITSHERRALMETLEPVLLRQPLDAQGPSPGSPAVPHTDHTAASPARVAVIGTGPTADATRVALEQAGATLAPVDSNTRFAVLVDHFLSPAEPSQDLLRSDIPHLLIRLTDQSVWLGPLVLPGGSPCLACVELHSHDREPLAGLLAAQLLGERPATDASSCAAIIAAFAALAYRHTLAESPVLVSTRLRFQVTDGRPTISPQAESVPAHPRCGCVSLAHSASLTHSADRPHSGAEAQTDLMNEPRWLPLRAPHARAA